MVIPSIPFKSKKSADSLEKLKFELPNLLVKKSPTRKTIITLTIPLRPKQTLKFTLLHQHTASDIAEKTYQASYGFEGSLRISFYLSKLHKLKYRLASDVSPVDVIKIVRFEIDLFIQEKMREGLKKTELANAVCRFVSTDIPEAHNAELFENYWLKTRDKDTFNYWEYLGRSFKTQVLSGGRVKCGICLDDEHGEGEALELDCGHCICRTCFKTYAVHMLDKDDVRKLCCPDCPTENPLVLEHMSPIEAFRELFLKGWPISLEKLRLVFTPDQLRKYVRLYRQLSFETFDLVFPAQSVQCPICERYLLKKRPKQEKVTCNCGYSFCALCKKNMHAGKKKGCPLKVPIPNDVLMRAHNQNLASEEIKSFENTYGKENWKLKLRLYADEHGIEAQLKKDKNYQRCPSCRIFVQKSAGCNKMICTRCKCKFCFRCGRDLKCYGNDSYRHFNADDSSPCRNKLWD